MKLIKKSRVVFAEDKLQEEFNKLSEGEQLKIQIKKAILELQSNAFCGIQIPKRLIPDIYIKKYKIENLWKYDLPDGWRIVYSIMPQNKVEIISVILEWFNHKEYERRFKY
jgi:Txe/YoeB family toxin of Txe-Axe toxin-antitoxin module